MTAPQIQRSPTRIQYATRRAFRALETFLHIEAVSGIILLIAAAVALIWANSSYSASYHTFWHTPISVGIGDFVFSRSLHFWINDGLMTIFFLVVGMEIRRELYDGALSNLRLASLPIIAAIGGVVAPAIIFYTINPEPVLRNGWAIPAATDIAFAVGVLALLGRSIPNVVRILLLALAIIDDVIAIIIIALFYSGGIDIYGLFVACTGIAVVLSLRMVGIGNAWAYVAPGVAIWLGLMESGAHPTLAGVVLGMMTPVLPGRSAERPIDIAIRSISEVAEYLEKNPSSRGAESELAIPLRELRLAQREMVAPVTRVVQALHPWVAFGIMPLFALANAGVTLNEIDLSVFGSTSVMLGVMGGLIIGKPLGIMLASWIAVRTNLCRLPPQASWKSMMLVGILGGIGFTMSIFVANLAFSDASLLSAAKLGVLLASVIAAIIGLAYGLLTGRRNSLDNCS